MRESPLIVKTVRDVREAVAKARADGRSVGFVPTMGALHVGHISLIEASKRDGRYTVVSIYVNPTQFAPTEDLATYPRTLDDDIQKCRAAGVELIFAPDNSEMYPPGDQTRVSPGPLAEKLCGAFRPGHFEGVCTVVAKLLQIVQPDTAYFGQKDAQQAVIIRRMVEDLRMPVRIEVCPLVRDADGLALSSRNARLRPEDRARALSLYHALCAGGKLLATGEPSMGRVIAAMRAVIAAHPEVRVDYLSLVDPETLEDIQRPHGRVMIAGAIRVGDVRLIDNMIVDLPVK